MHDAARLDWEVERRINFLKHSSAPNSDLIQLDLLVPKQTSIVQKRAAIFIRIQSGGSKPKNTAHATLKSHRVTSDGRYFIEFKGKLTRRMKIQALLSKNKSIRLHKNRIGIRKDIDLYFVKHLLRAARLLAQADK
jgi:hypothetical protein